MNKNGRGYAIADELPVIRSKLGQSQVHRCLYIDTTVAYYG